MENSSEDSTVICPGQKIHLTCSTHSSSFGWWYSGSDVIFTLDDVSPTLSDNEFYGVFFPSKMWSILEIQNTSRSYSLGCDNSSRVYNLRNFTLLQGEWEWSYTLGRFRW